MPVDMATKASSKANVSPLVNTAVLPGDVVVDLATAGKSVRAGGGLRQDGEALVATKAGILQFVSKRSLYWVRTSQRRYAPAGVEDRVIGMILDRHSEGFSVDIGGPFPASLPALSFEGATRRNRPNLRIGDLVLARVVASSLDTDPELACVDAHGRGMDMGPLKEGYLFHCSTGLARSLMTKEGSTILTALEEKGVMYELAVGINGRVWVKSSTPATTILVANAIMNSEFLSQTQVRTMVRKLIEG